MKPSIREQLARIETKARALAQSGEYYTFKQIESVLIARGYQEASKIFANKWSQAEVDRLCDQARSLRLPARAA
jgi:hypothetical protein